VRSVGARAGRTEVYRQPPRVSKAKGIVRARGAGSCRIRLGGALLGNPCNLALGVPL